MATTRLENANRTELYELARRRGVPGRSSMNREELLAAFTEHGSRARPAGSAEDEPLSRFEAFRQLARRRARGRWRCSRVS